MKEFLKFFTLVSVLGVIILSPVYLDTAIQFVAHGILGTDPIKLFTMVAHLSVLGCLIKYITDEN